MAMQEVLAVLVAGFLLGVRHATDSDHVVAVATIVTRERTLRGAARIGAAWGFGHSVTLLAVGGAIIAGKLAVPERLAQSLELCVAAMLVVLGAMNVGVFASSSQAARHRAAHHAHEPDAGARERRSLRSFSVGLVHGLAGSAAIALLVLSTIHASAWAFLYLALFAFGTVLAMTVLTWTMALPMAAAAARFDTLDRNLARWSGAASIALGLVLAYRIGFVQHLLAFAV